MNILRAAWAWILCALIAFILAGCIVPGVGELTRNGKLL